MHFLRTALVALVVAAAVPAMAEDLEFLLVNNASADLVGFHVSPAQNKQWEGNLLDGGFLAPGYEIGVVIADGATTCIYDIRGVFGDGESVEEFDLDLCELGTYTFTD